MNKRMTQKQVITYVNNFDDDIQPKNKLECRVWDSHNEKMLYTTKGDIVAVDSTGIIEVVDKQVEDIVTSGVAHTLYGKRYLPLFCTGRRDINNKLMYAGDIVEAILRRTNQKFVIELDYYDIEFKWAGVFSDDYFCLSVFKDFKILGNKYENLTLKNKISTITDVYLPPDWISTGSKKA